jgi:multidrug efflux system membrane fusion protein
MSATDEAPIKDSASRPTQRRPLAWLLLLLLAIGAAYWYFFARQPAPPPPAAPSQWRGPVPVRVVSVTQEDFTVQVQAIGTVTPLNSVVVRSRVAGLLAQVAVREGQQVKRGQVLAEIDPAPYKVALAQAEGQQLQNLAQLRNAERELERYRRLFGEDAVARQQLERQEALVQQLRGTLKADQAQVDNAKLQLSYTRIAAPLDGRVGMRRVDAGNLVGANDADGLFTILQTRPVAVSFSVPEAQVSAVRQAHAGKTPPVVEAWDREGRSRLAAGRLDTLDNQIDLATGTLRLKARFDNTDDALFPNQFVNVRLALQTLPGALTVPAEAIQHGSRGAYAYVIEDGKARVRPLVLGPGDSRRTVIVDGVAAGDAVVLEGLDRLEEGRAVTMVGAGPGAAR